jgi:outer membrane receptor protein involved in Fe transport
MTDISQIPVSAVDRIEVIADGASAIYGADAVAGVVNIITRNDFDGAETSASYGGADDGGASQVVASQMFGTSWDSGNILLNYEYNRQDDLDASQRDYLPDQGGAFSLIPENRKNSAFVAFRQTAGEQTTLSGNAFYGDRDTSMRQHQQNLFYVLDSTQSSEVKQTGASLALERAIVEDWSVTMNGTYSRMQQESVGEQAVDVSGDTLTESEASSKVYGLDMLVNGTLADLAAGELKTALGGAVREERFESLVVSSAGGFTSSNRVPEASRRVTSFFGELRVPVLGGSSQASQRMQLSGAVRYDDYDDVGSKVNSKFGIAWLPVDGVQLRATYGTSFRAPLLTELNQPVIPYAVPYPNPLSPTGVTNTVIVDGGNETLRPEKAKSFTAGVDFQLKAIPRLAVSLTYFNIDFRDRITVAPVTGNPFANPIAAPYITLNPPLADVQAWFDHPGFLGDFTTEGPEAVGAIWDTRRTNIASTEESGIDLTTTYGLETGIGNFDFTLSAERLLENNYEVAAGVPSVELLNTFAQPPKLKGRGGISWTQGSLQAALSINYVNSYTNGLGASPGVPGSAQTIKSWTTADLYFGYVTAGSGGLFGDMTLGLSISNVTDEQPPFAEIPSALTLPDENVLPFDAANASPIGRYVSFRVAKRW